MNISSFQEETKMDWLNIAFMFLSLMIVRATESQKLEEYEFEVSGFNPKLSSVFETPDPGRRRKILTTNSTALSSDDISCDPVLSTELIKTYDDYEKAVHLGYIFSSIDDTLTTPDKSMDIAAFKHFQEGGEIVLHTASCITHSVQYKPSTTGLVDKKFLYALIDIDRHIYEMDSDLAKRDVEKFVLSYGNHYTKKVYFGASIAVEIRVPMKVTLNVLRNLDGVVNDFFSSKSISKKDIVQAACGELIESCGFPSIKIATKGLIPQNLKSWRSVAIKFPAIVKVELEPLSSLMENEKFNSLIKQTILDSNDDGILVGSLLNEGSRLAASVLKFQDYLHIENECGKPSEKL